MVQNVVNVVEQGCKFKYGVEVWLFCIQREGIDVMMSCFWNCVWMIQEGVGDNIYDVEVMLCFQFIFMLDFLLVR